MLILRGSRPLLAGVSTLAMVVGWLVPSGVAAAQSSPDCYEQVWTVVGEDENGNPTYGWKLINVCETPGGGGQGGGPATCEHPVRGEVPCVHPVYGWWSQSEQCWVRLAEPQPAAGDEVWEGNDPADGAIYQFACPQTAGESFFLRFLAQPPDVPSIAQLARQAMESLPLAPARIGTAPDPDGVGLVGVPVWLWTEDTAATWGPVSVSVPGPGITVTAQGNAEQIAWDMGDGTTVICEAPGTPYDPSYGGQRSPDCGHVYRRPSLDQPGGRYQITATTTWHVRWWVEPQGSGAEGEDWFVRESSTSVEIHELQVVTS